MDDPVVIHHEGFLVFLRGQLDDGRHIHTEAESVALAKKLAAQFPGAEVFVIPVNSFFSPPIEVDG
jgi:hypothetical protein